MKKVLLAMALSVSLSGMAQVMTVNSVERLNLPAGSATRVAAISPQGDYVLLTSDENRGLTRYDLTTGATQSLTSAAGAGFDVKISPDGQNVVYREATIGSNHLRMLSLQTTNLATGVKRELIKPTHDLQGYSVDNATAATVTKGKFKAQAMAQAKADKKTPVLSVKNQQLMLTTNGKTRVFSPNGQNYSYIWPSISPDGSKALYYVCGLGAYVCNLDGTGLQRIGYLRAPVWYDDNTIVGMNDKDDGEFIYASTIEVMTLDGQHQTLTDDSIVAMYPHVSNGKIACSSPAGEAYIINVTK